MFTHQGEAARILRGASGFALSLWLTALPASAAIIYTNDFEAGVGVEWTPDLLSSTPSNSLHGETKFLGQFNHQTVALELNGLPTHTELTISFDLFLIGAWMGNKMFDGPDIWELRLDGGPVLLHTTFSNTLSPQAYPGAHPGENFPARTGASENNTLNFNLLPDSVYHLSFTLPHAAHAARFDFTGAPEANPAFYKRWGLDNVEVQVVPEPASLLLCGGLLLAAARRRN